MAEEIFIKIQENGGDVENDMLRKLSDNKALFLKQLGLKTKASIDIGDWNMDTGPANVSVAHGLSTTEWKTVRDISVMIRNDADTSHHTVTVAVGSKLKHKIDNTNFTLYYDDNQVEFNNSNFGSTSYNRGWITFFYTPD